jgi:hypothetical protein
MTNWGLSEARIQDDENKGLREKMRRMSEIVKPPRTPWGAFPDVLIHASESAVKQHPAYKRASRGTVLLPLRWSMTR